MRHLHITRQRCLPPASSTQFPTHRTTPFHTPCIIQPWDRASRAADACQSVRVARVIILTPRSRSTGPSCFRGIPHCCYACGRIKERPTSRQNRSNSSIPLAIPVSTLPVSHRPFPPQQVANPCFSSSNVEPHNAGRMRDAPVRSGTDDFESDTPIQVSFEHRVLFIRNNRLHSHPYATPARWRKRETIPPPHARELQSPTPTPDPRIRTSQPTSRRT
jgi:hypothetical protein